MNSSRIAERPTRPTAADIDQAAERLAGKAVLTPLLRFPVLDAACLAELLATPEAESSLLAILSANRAAHPESASRR